ncbi:glycosyltransferase family 8 protein [Mesorhizobium sp. NPDC059054]|uniref:glycosyltransferase family 8 protein n=1 Tax=Mesorhizobium sp. NPDC059054 TaxID=3346711 RepID=UPI0036C36375
MATTKTFGVAPMDICLAFDSNYVVPAQVSMETILKSNHSNRDKIKFWLISSNLSEEETDRIRRQLATRVEFKIITNLEMNISFENVYVPIFERLTPISLARIYLDTVIPKNIERIVYIDCDTICLGDIEHLFRLELGDNIVAAVKDMYLHTLGEADIPGLSSYPDLDLQHPYFNSGMMVIDTRNWRKHGVRERAESYLKANINELGLPDQDALNIALYNKWLQISDKWNFMKVCEETSPPTIDIADIKIAHFISSKKVWNDDYPKSALKEMYFRIRDEVAK